MGPKSYPHMGPLELVVYYIEGNDSRVHRLPSEGTVRLGRDSRNDIEIQDSSVSREHAILHIGSDLRIEDMSSCNGTEVYKPGKYSGTDTTMAHHPERNRAFNVEIGDRIKLGSVHLVIRKALFEPEKGTSGPRMWMEAPTVSDPLMEALYDDVREAGQSSLPLPVLIYGETGAGKERVAQTVHDASPRRSRPFVTVNCTQFTASLVDSSLFGHLKGSFSGAISDKKGFFHVADTGTLFLDEIADLPMEIQVKLLRVLEYGEVYPVGSTKPDFVDVRVIAATNQNLIECVRQGKFREDLYYRLRGLEFEVPPLRNRSKDIIPLAERFLSDACRRDNQPNAIRFSEAALGCLRSYPFPGNVRELKKAVEVAAVRCRGAMILPEHLPNEIAKMKTTMPEPKSTPHHAAPVPSASRHAVSPLPVDNEKALILQALHAHGGNQKAAAAALGICNRTLVNRLNRYPDIPRPKKKNSEPPHVNDLPPNGTNGAFGSHSYDGWPNGEF